VNTFMNLTALASLAVSVACMIFSVSLARLLTPGLAPESLERVAQLMRWLLPGVVLASVNQLVSSIFYANGRFFAPMVPRLAGPLLIIACAYFFSPSLGVKSLVIATLAASLLQTFILFAGLRKHDDFRFSLDFDPRHPAVRKILRLMLPMMIGMCFYKLAPAFERWIASGMPPGSISTLGYATRLVNVLQPVLVSGISVSGFALCCCSPLENR
jgi:putative peptidoglycan lipid II flippase